MRKLFVLVATVAMVLAFTLPAMAQAQWSFYGSVRMWTAWESVDEMTPPLLSGTGTAPFNGSGTQAAAWRTAGLDNQADSDLEWKQQTNSRIGANVKWGDIGGRFEYGLSKDGANPSLRMLYGTWNFGPATLLVGQDWTPWYFMVSGECGPGGGECNGYGLGSIYDTRKPQLKLTMGGFQFALVQPYTIAPYTLPAAAVNTFMTTKSLTSPFTAATVADTDRTIPRIDASYTFTLGPVGLYVGGLYNMYRVQFTQGSQIDDVNVKGWQLGLGARSAFGPFYLNGAAQYARNPNNATTGYATIIPSMFLYNPATGQKEDANYWAFQVIPGFKLSDNLSIEAGVSYQQSKVDNPAVAGQELKEEVWNYYLQVVFSPAKNVFIVPEIGVIDYKELDVTNYANRDLGKLTWFGIKWQINF